MLRLAVVPALREAVVPVLRVAVDLVSEELELEVVVVLRLAWP